MELGQEPGGGPANNVERILWALMGGICLSSPGCIVGRIIDGGHGRGDNEKAGIVFGIILGAFLGYALSLVFIGDKEKDCGTGGSEE